MNGTPSNVQGEGRRLAKHIGIDDLNTDTPPGEATFRNPDPSVFPDVAPCLGHLYRPLPGT
jgi:hypothetical protein